MSEQEKMGPQEFNDALFNALQDHSGTALALRKDDPVFPWVGHPEDHAIPEGYVASLYESLRLKPPRFAWSTSPAAMYTAIDMLMGIQAGQRHKFIESLVVSADPLASAKKTVLDAIIDRTVTTTLGAAIKSMIGWKSRCTDLWFADLNRLFHGQTFGDHTASRRATRSRLNEVTVYPVDHFEGVTALAPFVFSFVPYMHACFICLPPTNVTLYENGHLCEMQFGDGYAMSLADPDIPTVPALPSGESQHVLFAMCAMNKHEGCGGVFVDEETAIRTICSCECHGGYCLKSALTGRIHCSGVRTGTPQLH